VTKPPQPDSSLQVWRIRRPDDVGSLDHLLPADEQEQGRLQKRASPELYVAARAFVRSRLGAVLDVAPRDVPIGRSCGECGSTAHGKPRLIGTTSPLPDFSISYGGEVALVALTARGHVGVDVEPITSSPEVSRWCFDEGEREQLAALDAASRLQAITSAWVRKEAIAKACGRGLSLPLRSVATTGAPSRWRLPSRAWRIRDVPMPDGLAGAVAYDDTAASPEVASWVPGRR